MVAQITWGQATHIGLVREINEDSVLSLHFIGDTREGRGNLDLFIVADGMGGSGPGAQASALTVQTIAENLLGVLLRQTPLTIDQDLIRKELDEAIQAANLKILRTVNIQYGAASTITTALIMDKLVIVGHVGDTAAYQIANGEIQQLTHVHTLVHELIRLGHITWEQARSHPMGNVLYRALGLSETLEVDTLSFPLLPGSHLLLCSDGLWNNLQAEEMTQIVMNATTPQQACDDWIALANSRGGYDNISVIVIRG